MRRAAQKKALRIETIEVEGIPVTVTWKPIRHLHLRIRPPDGAVTVSVPRAMPAAEVRAVVVQRLPWIVRHRERIMARAAPVLQVVTGELLPHRGVPHQLEVVEGGGRAGVEVAGRAIRVRVPVGADRDARLRVLERWQREALREHLAELLAVWEPRIGRDVAEWRIKRMRTRWGTCNPRARRLWFSLSLALAPPRCVEYVVVHELVHLLERGHNARFWGLVEGFLPDWRARRDELNRGSAGTNDCDDVAG